VNLCNKFNQEVKKDAARRRGDAFSAPLFAATLQSDKRNKRDCRVENLSFSDSALLRQSALTADVTCTSTLFHLDFGGK